MGDVEWFRTFFGESYLRFDRHDDTEEEVDFIERVLELEKGDRVLDLCCGYGRHAIRLARRGYEVVGYDLSPVMLARAREESRRAGVKVEWIEGDVREFDAQEEFDAVINMFNSFGYFEEEDAQFDVLRRIHRALKTKGVFLIETVNRDFLVRHVVPRTWFRVEGMWVLEERHFDVVSNRSRVDVTVVDGGREESFYHSVRVYSYTELEMLLAASGLITLAVYGDFEGSAYTWDAPRMIVVAQK